MQSFLQAIPAGAALGLPGTEWELGVKVNEMLTSFTHDNGRWGGKPTLV